MSFGTKKITLFKAISLALLAACLMTLFMPWLTLFMPELSMSYGDIHEGVSVFTTGIQHRYVSFWSVMLIINASLLILLSGLAVFGLLKDKNALVLPAALVAFLMFFLAVFQKAYIYGAMQREMFAGSYIDFDDVFLGVGAWLNLPLSLLLITTAILDNLAAGKKAIVFSELNPGIKFSAGTGMGGWICPTCGAKLGGGQIFCDRCGTKKPEPPRCPGCGRVCLPGELFCEACGTKL